MVNCTLRVCWGVCLGGCFGVCAIELRCTNPREWCEQNRAKRYIETVHITKIAMESFSREGDIVQQCSALHAVVKLGMCFAVSADSYKGLFQNPWYISRLPRRLRLQTILFPFWPGYLLLANILISECRNKHTEYTRRVSVILLCSSCVACALRESSSIHITMAKRKGGRNTSITRPKG